MLSDIIKSGCMEDVERGLRSILVCQAAGMSNTVMN